MWKVERVANDGLDGLWEIALIGRMERGQKVCKAEKLAFLSGVSTHLIHVFVLSVDITKIITKLASDF